MAIWGRRVHAMLLRSVYNKEALDSRVVIGSDCHTPNTVNGLEVAGRGGRR